MKTFYQTTPMNAYMKPVEVAPESWGGAMSARRVRLRLRRLRSSRACGLAG